MPDQPKRTTSTSAADDAALEDLISTLRDDYRDAFGRYPSERQMEDFLEEHPGALDLWKQVSRHA